jgi:hypothetical protein
VRFDWLLRAKVPIISYFKAVARKEQQQQMALSKHGSMEESKGEEESK